MDTIRLRQNRQKEIKEMMDNINTWITIDIDIETLDDDETLDLYLNISSVWQFMYKLNKRNS